MMIEELKKAWVKELREKRHGIANWLIHAYCPRLCLFSDGSILFCPREFIQKIGEFKVVIILDSFQEELIQWIQSENIKNIDTDDYIIEKIIKFICQEIKEYDEYPVYIVM